MITGKTQSGFEYQINDNIGDDYELLELMGKVKDGDQLAIFAMIDRILGPAQHKALKEHCRLEDGHVSTTRMNSEIVEIFTNTKEVKNS